jgi:hypothetical protein
MATTEARLEDQSQTRQQQLRLVHRTVASISFRDFGAVHGNTRFYDCAGCLALNW